MIRLGQAEGADMFTRCQLRQVALLLVLGAVGVDRVHHQRGLHAHGAAVGAVAALNRTGNQAIHDGGSTRTAIALQTDAQETGLAEFLIDAAVEGLVAVRFQHARHQLLVGETLGHIIGHALVFGELTR